MPNYCHNTLIIEGTTKQLSEFKDKLEMKKDYSLEDLFPMPDILSKTIAPSVTAIGQEYANQIEIEIAEREGKKVPEPIPCSNNTEEKQTKLIKKYGHSDWYEWKNDNWGTKWILDFDLVDSMNEKLIYTFDSAWAPPIPLLEKISSEYANLKFSITYNVFEVMGDETELIVIKKGNIEKEK